MKDPKGLTCTMSRPRRPTLKRDISMAGSRRPYAGGFIGSAGVWAKANQWQQPSVDAEALGL
ncbi:hypothetical protein [Desulfotomaculum nigrificans]|uniref:hypothetical protein n=1 Tax=Desulfotomaculum nigrificans TaxID=1565 RepID=UPI000487C25C|nr:hypothetical protein [Desulfotomaculum nigrificans]